MRLTHLLALLPGVVLVVGCQASTEDDATDGPIDIARQAETKESTPPPEPSTGTATERRRCGAQYAGNPYLKCNFQDGREAIPEVCTRYYVNCGGIQVHLSTQCIGAIRGSAEHHALAFLCDLYGSGVLNPDRNEDEHAIPPDFDLDAFSSSKNTTVTTYPGESSNEVKP